MTLKEALQMKKRPKYGNHRIKTPDGDFDGEAEYGHWLELKLLQMAGGITDLQRQVPFVLIPSQRGSDGKVIEQPVKYIADFVYTENGGTVVEDVKGYKTPEYIIKRKLMDEARDIQRELYG